MKKMILALMTVSTLAHAGSGNYTCFGRDRKGNTIKIQIKNELPRTAYRDIKVVKNNRAAVIYKHVDAYGGDEGYDVGMNTRDFSVWLHQPPNMLGTDEVAASFFLGQQQDLNKRSILRCK